MKTVLFVLLGLIAGAFAGGLAAFILVALWYDVLGFGAQGDGLTGFSSFVVLGLLLAILGGVAGTILMARRANAAPTTGGKGGGMAVTAIVVILVIGILGLWLSGVIY